MFNVLSGICHRQVKEYYFPDNYVIFINRVIYILNRKSQADNAEFLVHFVFKVRAKLLILCICKFFRVGNAI